MKSESGTAVADDLSAAHEELMKLRSRIADLQKASEPESVGEYTLKELDGNDVALASLFGDKDDLILVHNMGSDCAYCTMWADGFNGLRHHLEDRAAFVLVSADSPSKAKEFAASRQWGFRVLSKGDSPFTRDMGYEDEKGSPHPGVSTFHRNSQGKITRIAHAPFGPGDDFCATWPLLGMLKDGANDWHPKFSYAS